MIRYLTIKYDQDSHVCPHYVLMPSTYIYGLICVPLHTFLLKVYKILASFQKQQFYSPSVCIFWTYFKRCFFIPPISLYSLNSFNPSKIYQTTPFLKPDDGNSVSVVISHQFGYNCLYRQVQINEISRKCHTFHIIFVRGTIYPYF